MNEPPGARARVALSALTVAEYFRDEEGPGRAPLRRQHLPLHAGRLGSVRAPRSHPERRRLPAHALHRDGRAPGAHHVDDQGLDHQRAGRSTSPPTTSPTRRRPRPSPTSTRPPSLARDLASSASTRPSIRSTRRRRMLDPTVVGERPLQRRARGPGDAPEVQGSAGHHRHPRHGRALARTTSSSSRAPARSSASSRSPSSSPRSSPASTGKFVPLKETIAGFEEILDGKLDDDSPEQAFYLVRQHRRGEGRPPSRRRAARLMADRQRSPSRSSPRKGSPSTRGRRRDRAQRQR